MRVDESLALLTPVTSARVQSLIQAWRVGQILEAVVERTTNVGNSTLNVNNQSFDVRTTQPLPVGARLALEVAQTGTRIMLRVVQLAAPRQPVEETLRALLPRQGALEPALTRLATWAPPPAATTAPASVPPHSRPTSTASAIPLPPSSPAPLAALSDMADKPPAGHPLLELARKVIDRLPTPSQVQSPEHLRDAIRNAGPFFERKLASNAPPPELDAALDGDLKAGLLRLADALRTLTRPAATPAAAAPASSGDAATAQRDRPRAAPAVLPRLDTLPAELLALEDDVRAALARVTVHQLAALPQDESSPPQWLLDIPVRNGERVDILHLHIFREPKPRDPRYPPAWCVRLSFDLVALGSVDVLVTYYALAVSVSVWTREAATAALFRQHLENLRTRLLDDGVHVNHMHCECGAAPFAHDPVGALKHHSLIDERA